MSLAGLSVVSVWSLTAPAVLQMVSTGCIQCPAPSAPQVVCTCYRILTSAGVTQVACTGFISLTAPSFHHMVCTGYTILTAPSVCHVVCTGYTYWTLRVYCGHRYYTQPYNLSHHPLMMQWWRKRLSWKCWSLLPHSLSQYPRRLIPYS